MKRLTATAGTKSKLAKPVQELIKMIFDVESMKKAMVEFEVRPAAATLLLSTRSCCGLVGSAVITVLLFRLTSRRCPWGS